MRINLVRCSGCSDAQVKAGLPAQGDQGFIDFVSAFLNVALKDQIQLAPELCKLGKL